jgi:uncharacterized protein (TIGR04255 family)
VAKHTQLLHPPLREALIDLQLREDLPVSFVESLKGKELSGYPSVKPIKRGQFSFQIDLQKPSQASVKSEEPFGWRYETNDGSRVVQLRRNGVTYSVLRSYTNWDELKASTKAVWQQYGKWAGTLRVERLAVRYINVFELPAGGADFDDYLTASPRVPPELPQAVSGFLQRVVIPFSTDGTTAIVTQALELPAERGVPVVLDIDVYRKCELVGDSLEVWSQLDKFRGIKNAIFFSSVTEKALEPYR